MADDRGLLGSALDGLCGPGTAAAGEDEDATILAEEAGDHPTVTLDEDDNAAADESGSWTEVAGKKHAAAAAGGGGPADDPATSILHGNPFRELASTASGPTADDDELGETDRAANRSVPDPSMSGPAGSLADATDEQLAASRDAAVAELLGICERSGVTIGPHLRRAILGEEMFDASLASSAESSGRPRRSMYAKRESALTFLARRNNESFNDESVTRESDVAAEIRRVVDVANVQRNMSFEVRVRGGSYTVESPVAGGSGKREAGTQHIPTVTNVGGFFRCYDAARRLARTGTLRKETETKVVMDGINLILEEGKMYLILGAPGGLYISCLVCVSSCSVRFGSLRLHRGLA